MIIKLTSFYLLKNINNHVFYDINIKINVVFVTKTEKPCLYQFIPEKYLFLTKTKKIKYKNINLKSDYLISIINEMLIKYYFHKEDLIDKEIQFNMWSVILRERYGTKYNYYIDFLIESGFLIMISDYYRSKKARTYKLNIQDILNIKKCKVDDNILMKKSSKEFLMNSFLEHNNSPIPFDIRKKLVDDLYHIDVDIDSCVNYLNELKDTNGISLNKYYKNLMSIDNLSTSNIFFKFDEYGRMHTNFTVLKKHIRQNYIKIDGMLTKEVDLSNSQPLFLTVLMKKQMSITKLIEKDVTNYMNLVESGLIYEYIMEHTDISERDDAKILIYKVLFGYNGESQKENRIFNELFPNVYGFIKDYKTVNDDYKSLSHELQSLESDFIYNKVIRHIMNTYPHIKLFTIHDSVSFSEKYYNEVFQIFNYYKRNIFNV